MKHTAWIENIGEDQIENPIPDNKSSSQSTSLRAYSIKELSKLKIGELLVKERLIKEKDVKRALLIQKLEAEEAGLSIGKLLLNHGLIEKSQLQDLLDHPDLRKSIGQLALDKRLITKKQLVTCRKKSSSADLIGYVMRQEGMITEDQLKALFEEQQRQIPMDRLARKLNLVNEKDLQEVIKTKRNQRTIGEILCARKKITPTDLNFVLQKYSKQLELGEFLLKQHIISQEQLNIALLEHKHSKKPLGKILLDRNYITIDQLYTAWSREWNIPYHRQDQFSFPIEKKHALIRIVKRKYAKKNGIVPISLENKILTLAIFDPHHLYVIHDLENVYTDLQIDCVLINEPTFAEIFDNLYEDAGLNEFENGSEKKQSLKSGFDDTFDEKETPTLNSNLPELDDIDLDQLDAEQLVDIIIKLGLLNHASDIHIEQDRQGMKLRYRVDGVLQKSNLGWLDEQIQAHQRAIISRIKVLSNLDIAEKRLPQDGVFRINYIDQTTQKKYDLDFRVATCPAIVGENITVRILDSRKTQMNIDNLHHSTHVLEPLKQMLKSAAGMILVSGPTGSGKTSTLYAALRYIHDPGIKIITAEDPIEYNFPGIMQTQVNAKIKLNFARLLRSFLRLDPDVILVGEIRDPETAQIGFDAAQTGHLLLSTIHTNDAIGSIPRLLDLGIDRSQIASCLMGVLAQRLIRKLCPNCIAEYMPYQDEWHLLFSQYPQELTFHKGTGCRECNFTGYLGRLVLSELFEVDKDIAMAISEGANEKEIKQMALVNGMQTMVDDGILKLDRTTLDEIVRVIPHDMMKAFKSRHALSANRIGLTLNDTEIEGSIKCLDATGQGIPKLSFAEPDFARQLKHELEKNILESYYNVLKQHHCKNASVSIKAKHGKIEIVFTPDWEKNPN